MAVKPTRVLVNTEGAPEPDAVTVADDVVLVADDPPEELLELSSPESLSSESLFAAMTPPPTVGGEEELDVPFAAVLYAARVFWPDLCNTCIKF